MVKNLSLAEWTYLKDGNIDSMLQESLRYWEDVKSRSLLLGINTDIDEIRVYYMDCLLWLYMTVNDSLVLELNYGLLLVYRDVYVPDEVTDVILISRADIHEIIDGKEITAFGDIHTKGSISDSSKGLFDNMKSCTIVKQYCLDYVGYFGNYALAGHKNYKRPSYKLGYCNFFYFYIMTDYWDVYLDMLDWLKDTDICYMCISFDFATATDKTVTDAELHQKVDDTIIKYCDKMLPFLKEKFAQSLSTVYIYATVWNDKLDRKSSDDSYSVSLNYTDYEQMQESLKSNMLDYTDSVVERIYVI